MEIKDILNKLNENFEETINVSNNIIENQIVKDAEKQQHLMKIRNARLRASYYDGDEILNFSSVTKVGKERIYEIIENIISKNS